MVFGIQAGQTTVLSRIASELNEDIARECEKRGIYVYDRGVDGN